MMKLGMISGWDEGSLARVASFGLHYVEFDVNVGCNVEEFKKKVPEIKANLEKYNLKVGHMGRWGEVNIDENGAPIEEAMQNYFGLIDCCKEFGCHSFCAGANDGEAKLDFHAKCEGAIAVFKRLVEYAADKDVKISSYNCDWGNFLHSPEVWNVVLSAVPEMGIKYDPSHCYNRGNDYLAELRDWGDRVTHFHLKGTLHIKGQRYDDPPIGLDTIQWGAVFDMLYTKNYDGMVSLEPHSSYWRGGTEKGDWGLRFAINYAKQFLMPGALD